MYSSTTCSEFFDLTRSTYFTMFGCTSFFSSSTSVCRASTADCRLEEEDDLSVFTATTWGAKEG
jgi:hypothetical protein